MRGRTLWALLASVALVLSCGDLAAQTSGIPAPVPKAAKPYALIFGTAWDDENHPAYGVHVRLRRSGDKKPHWEAYSDHRGEFAFRVPAGKATYELAGESKSDKTNRTMALATHEPVSVAIELDERIDVSLHLMKR